MKPNHVLCTHFKIDHILYSVPFHYMDGDRWVKISDIHADYQNTFLDFYKKLYNYDKLPTYIRHDIFIDFIHNCMDNEIKVA